MKKYKMSELKYGNFKESTDWLDTAARSIEAEKNGNLRGAEQLATQARFIMFKGINRRIVK